MREPWPFWSGFEARLEPWKKLGVHRSANGAVQICHLPKIAPRAYLLTVYPGLTLPELGAAEDRVGRIPDPLREFYQAANGAWLYRILSISGYVGALTRDADEPQPIDMWADNIRRSSDGFVFGGIVSWSAKAKLGIWPDGVVRLINEDNLAEMPKEWPDFPTFLLSEMDRLASFHNADGVYTGTWADCFPPEAAYLEKKNPGGRPRDGMA